MSRRYKGAIISATPPTTTGGESGTAPGEWTLQQQAQAQNGGIWPAQPVPKYIEDVFSTYLYTGTGADKTITNGIDLASKGGLVWTKIRNAAGWHALADTTRGVTKIVWSNSDSAQSTVAQSVKSFNSDGYSIGSTYEVNNSGSALTSWTFRKQSKFFDIVTYTGNSGTQNIAHNLGSVPGCIIVKKTSGVANWGVYHRSLGNTNLTYLNLTDPTSSGNDTWGSTTPTSTQFTVGADGVSNLSGQTYVAYLFAHNAGGFGSNFTDNVISCGSFTTNGSGVADVNLGYEAQWVLYKPTTTATWQMMDSMRGMPDVSSNVSLTWPTTLFPNTSAAESGYDRFWSTSTGFKLANGYGSQQYIYIAIRKGPMRIPTDATTVFSPNIIGANTGATTGFPVDLTLSKYQTLAVSPYAIDRLRGTSTSYGNNYLKTNVTDAEGFQSGSGLGFDNNTGFTNNFFGAADNATWNFRRAPGFFDEVCYSGNGGSSQTINHNLAATPELMIVKTRNGPSNGSWLVYSAYLGFDYGLELNSSGLPILSNYWGYTAPTSSVFTVGSSGAVNASSTTYVAYLFASCPNVCKVGIYDGTSELTTINCEFTGGARWVMIKQTSWPGGNWYVWDTARGMVSGTDPSLSLNSNAVQVSGDSVYTTTGGFQVLASPAVDINTAGATYIYIAIA